VVLRQIAGDGGGMRDLDLQECERLTDLVVEFAGETAAAFLFDFQNARGELLQFAACLLDFGEVARGAALEILRVSQTALRHHQTQQDTQCEHREQTTSGASARFGEFALAVHQLLLVGHGECAERVVQLAAARDYLAVEEKRSLLHWSHAPWSRGVV
jgi:hypothetical protein